MMHGFNVFLSFCLALVTASAFAEDAVWYLPPPPESIGQTGWLPQPFRKLAGSIQAIDAKGVRIIVDASDGQSVRERMIDLQRLVWIEADWSSEEVAIQTAFKDFEAGRFQASLGPLSQYVRTSTVRWRKQLTYGQLMFAAAQCRKFGSSLAISTGFYQSEPPACMLALLPIAWTTPMPDSARDAAAAKSLANPSPATRLIAASWTLSGRDRTRAIAVLDQLKNDTEHPLIARLADVVSWRTVTGDAVVKNISQWEIKTDALPIALQPGPMATIASRLEASGRERQAQAWWLRVAMLGRHIRPLVAEAEKHIDQ